MNIDSIPEDKKESYPCPNYNCKGSIIETEKDIWECDTCEWQRKL